MMPRHHIFACCFVCISLVGLPPIKAEEPPALKTPHSRSSSQAVSNPVPGTTIPYKPVPIAPEMILSRWSAASRFLSPVTPQSRVEGLKRGNQTYFTGHELALISEFQQPVTAEMLQTEYEWRVVSQSETMVILRGQSTDPLTRRLCRPFELRINGQSMLPESLTFLSETAHQKQSFGAIELTALKALPTPAPQTVVATPPAEFVSRTVMKATFPQTTALAIPGEVTNPIKRISFSKISSESKNAAELQEIEKLVARWILESERIESIRLGNGITIVCPEDPEQRTPPAQNSSKSADPLVSNEPGYQSALQPWLINVNQKSFLIESFSIELAADATGPQATRFITLKLKPNPDADAAVLSAAQWDAVELEFNSDQPLPVKISTTRHNVVRQFLLSDIKLKYAR